MDYAYENLGDDRFQEFCQALIVKEFPNTQVFPTGQPDGGRDSITYLAHSEQNEFIVFQVKYVKNPFVIKDPHKWLIEILKDEIPKIVTLIPKGAKQYYLVTNVKGTAHLDTGSIDIVSKLLNEQIAIPSMCWWRDDLSRRLDNNSDLKWSYVDILSGQDILNSALFSHLNEFKERRENVIRAYLADQYALDDQVKFRQVDLQNRLLTLFTDVPFRLKKYSTKNKSLKRKLYATFEGHQNVNLVDDAFIFDERGSMGAAKFILSSDVQRDIERILLEGGPGQGKSTISQYISQIHRIHLLSKKADLLLIPKELKTIPVRLPFKIDLRHMAAWVEGKNPYVSKLSDESFNKIWQKSLESFLLGHILYHSQLDGFDRNDLIAVFKLSPIILVFDGFDEIANLKIREDVIELINKGVDRIKENSKSIQIIVTSRPAAFVDSVSFCVDQYPHFELTDVTPEITKEYVEKWIKASKLDSREAAEIRRLVEEKLKMPHLKDLAKSPMQLAIFISLLRKKGESLPNKRTAMYDNYIDLFFDRESEKSSVIRDNRDLIIDIHEYLGWILHSEAELYKTSGSIEISALKDRLKDYLQSEGHKTDITDKLFDVVKERVCALASRVQGTFEFEVQPLREYFCAKYLYKTSPYSPLGSEKTGTKPERFAAISLNYYWQNTVRFFAGCFDKGELPMLIQQLKELQQNDLLKFTNYPRILTSQILSDYVFTQYPLLLKDAIKIIIDGVNIGSILNQDESGRLSNNEPILLPMECGRDEVVLQCFEELKKFPLIDYAEELIGIIKNNPFKTSELWNNYAITLQGEKLTLWLEYAYKMQIMHKMGEEMLTKVFEIDKINVSYRLQLLINASRLDIIDNDNSLKRSTLEGILDNEIIVVHRQHLNHSLRFLSSCLRVFALTAIIKNEDLTFAYFNTNNRQYYYNINEADAIKDIAIKDDIDRQIEEYKLCVDKYLSTNIAVWRSKIEPWDCLVENGIKIFGNHWLFHIIGVIGAGIRSRDEKFEGFYDLDDDTKSLCKRIRYARMKSGSTKYWEVELNFRQNLDLRLLIFFTWATPKVIINLLPMLSSIVDMLPKQELRKITKALGKTAKLAYFSVGQIKLISEALTVETLSNSVKVLLSLRMEDEYRGAFIYHCTEEQADMSQAVINSNLNYLINKYLDNPEDINVLEAVHNTYNKLQNFSNKFVSTNTKGRNNGKVLIPLDVSKKIMLNCKSYPRVIASFAERSCRTQAFRSTKPIGEIAKQDKWFS